MPEGENEQAPDSGEQEQQQEPLTYDGWIETQTDEVRTLIDGRTRGLKGALDAERAERKEFERQLRDVARKLDKESEARQVLEQHAARLGEMEQQAEFYDLAHREGATNLRLAWLAARDAGLVDDRGRVNIDRLKSLHPQLFPQPQPQRPTPGNAGTGTAAPPPTSGGMNEFIRRAAGRSK